MWKLDSLEISGLHLLIGIFLIPIVFYVIKNIIRKLMYQTKITGVIDIIFTKRYLSLLGEVLLLILFFSLFLFQKRLSIRLFEPTTFKFNLIEIYGFVIGILSIYGIYIGFLQFVIGDSEKSRWLGKNKLKYLTDTSIWYQITQTKYFLITLFILVILPVPIIYTSDEIQNDLLYIWQASLVILLCIYIFLIGMSLEMLLILFLIKGESDWGLERNIKKYIENEYHKYFKKMYKYGFDAEKIEIFFRKIANNLQKVNDEEVDEFILTIFSEINKNMMYPFGEFKKVRKIKTFYGTDDKFLYYDYKRFVYKKWEFLTRIQEDIRFSSFKELIDDDMFIISQLVKENPEFIEERNVMQRMWYEQNENTHEYLFDKLIEKAILDNRMDELCNEVKRTTMQLEHISNEKKILIDFYTNIEKYKWEKIFEEYWKNSGQFELPKFRKKEERVISTNRYQENIELITIDPDNYELYSSVLFHYLISNFGDLDKKHFDNEKIKKMIKAMDKEYSVAYSLYQLLYPDGKNNWNETTFYFGKQLDKYFDFFDENEQREKLYMTAASKVSNTHIGHRITLKVLRELFDTRYQIITSMTYFEQFPFSRISMLKWLYVQEMLVEKYECKSSSILIDNKEDEKEQRLVEELVVSYLRMIDDLPELSTNEGLRDKIVSLFEWVTIRKWLLSKGLGIVGLMYYEYLLMYHTKNFNQEIFIDAIRFSNDEKERYYFMSDGILEFFVWKLIDDTYKKIFENKEILFSIKSKVSYTLRSKNMTVNEFVEEIYIKLDKLEFLQVGKIDIDLITDRLSEILFE